VILEHTVKRRVVISTYSREAGGDTRAYSKEAGGDINIQ
jgi:hypothetical protein